jgi:hypothetical protein
LATHQLGEKSPRPPLFLASHSLYDGSFGIRADKTIHPVYRKEPAQ